MKNEEGEINQRKKEGREGGRKEADTKTVKIIGMKDWRKIKIFRKLKEIKGNGKKRRISRNEWRYEGK